MRVSAGGGRAHLPRLAFPPLPAATLGASCVQRTDSDSPLLLPAAAPPPARVQLAPSHSPPTPHDPRLP